MEIGLGLGLGLGVGVMLAWSSEVPSSSRCRGMLLIDSKRCCERLAGRVRAG